LDFPGVDEKVSDAGDGEGSLEGEIEARFDCPAEYIHCHVSTGDVCGVAHAVSVIGVIRRFGVDR
jgi:hypothetical protein